MTGLEIYAIVKFWLPLTAAFGLVIKAWHSSKAGITEWADRLLNNHLHHIQEATESTAHTLKSMSDANVLLVAQITRIADDSRRHQDEDRVIQNNILTGIEVLKAKVN